MYKTLKFSLILYASSLGYLHAYSCQIGFIAAIKVIIAIIHANTLENDNKWNILPRGRQSMIISGKAILYVTLDLSAILNW